MYLWTFQLPLSLEIEQSDVTGEDILHSQGNIEDLESFSPSSLAPLNVGSVNNIQKKKFEVIQEDVTAVTMW